ncbi:MAG: cache domain-containing protein [Acetivibrio ethanolgignens]
MSVRKKLVIMFAVMVIVLGFSIGVQSYESSRIMVIENKKNEMSDTINRIDININFWVLNVAKFAERTVEEQLKEAMLTGDSSSTETMQEWFSDYIQIIEAVSDVAVFDDRGKMVYHYQETGDNEPDSRRLALCYQKAFAAPEGEVWLDMGCALYSKDEVVTMVKAVPGESESKPCGLLVIELNPDVFKSLLLNNQSVAANQYMLIVDQSGQIVCGSDKIQPDWMDDMEAIFRSGSQNFELNVEQGIYYVCGQYNGVTGWKTYSIVSIEDIFPQLSELRKSISVLVALTVLVALYFVILFSCTFTEPIQKLVDGMNEVQQENLCRH